jgi:hypothetical protein
VLLAAAMADATATATAIRDGRPVDGVQARTGV